MASRSYPLVVVRGLPALVASLALEHRLWGRAGFSGRGAALPPACGIFPDQG